MQITQSNYYSAEADKVYWSASQIKSFLTCEARAKAELDGLYVKPSTTALLIGSYVDCRLTEPDKFELFIRDHPEMFKKDGSIKSDFVKAEEMIERAKSDDVFMSYLGGEHQKIFTGELFGLPFKAKLDAYKAGQYITDLKTVKDLEPIYKAGEGKLNPVEYWMWDIQLSIYAALEGNNLPIYLALITKQTPPDLKLVELELYKREACLEYLAEIMPRLDAIKAGIIEPARCENCDYCRATRKITKPIAFDDWANSQYEG